MRLKITLAAVATVAAVAVSACGSGSTGAGFADNYPSEDMHWTVAFGPGGGSDLMSRTLVQIIQDEKLYPGNIAVENREVAVGRPAGAICCPKRAAPTTSRPRRVRSLRRPFRPTPAGRTRTSPTLACWPPTTRCCSSTARATSRPSRTGSATPRAKARSSSAASAP